MAKQIDLLKIDPALARDAKSVDGVLVVFVAPYERGQRIVGWYRSATVYRESVPYPPEVKDRIQKRLRSEGISNTTFSGYRLEAKICDSILLPEERRVQGPMIPSGHHGEMGQSNVCYAYKQGGRKTSPWIQEAIDFIDGYQGLNRLTYSEAEAEATSFDAQEKAAGFQSNPEIRRVVEKYAMDRAKEELRGLGFSNFDDTSARECYDYTCKRGRGFYYVEVKGTQGAGASVILTKNELEHGKKHRRNSIAVIVYHVKVDPDGESFHPSGGTVECLSPWILESAALEPIQYRWTVSGCPELLRT